MDMNVKKIREKLMELAPEDYAMEWDNSGLLLGKSDKEVKRIMIAVDVDDRTIQEATDWRADLLISHHPLLFKTVKRITNDDMIGRRIINLLQSDVAYYAMHTNYDVCRMGQLAAEILKLIHTEPIEETKELNGQAVGIGVMGQLKEECTLSEFVRFVKSAFGLEEIRYFDREGTVRNIAVCPGSGSSVIKTAIQKGADVLVTGDIGHHDGIDARDQGLAILDAGHYGLEYIFMEDVKNYLYREFGAEIEIRTMEKKMPYSVLV